MEALEVFAYVLTVLGALGFALTVWIAMPIYSLVLSSCFIALGYGCAWKVRKIHKSKEQLLK